MPPWTPVDGWMHLERLDDGDDVDGAFVLAFKITDDGADLWSSRMRRFKDKEQAALFGAAKCMKSGILPLMKAIGLKPSRTIFVPAISSRETVANEAAFLTMLASATANAAGSTFSREIVRKQAHSPLHGIFDAAGRTAELAKAAYQARRIADIDHAVIVDDFITRGSTMSRMAQALKASNPGITVHGVALGKTERRAYWGDRLTNDNVDGRWDALWLRGEQRYHERP